ncbi:MAG TPA: endonuclease III [Actinomycetota bacterium]|nr:endonuclease III [Actinomycetota bacterium]
MHRRLASTYGPLDAPRTLDPLEELILTVLSQNTNDLNRDRAFAAMRDRYPTWETLAEAAEPELEEAIRPGGLSNIKARRILAILDEIRDREGGSLDLSWMQDASSKRVAAYLLSLPGVGPKTVACVLAFSLGRPALPVDTHVYRVAQRLGLFGPETDAERAHAVMEKLVPPRLRVPLHVGMIRHGRATCRAGRPACEVCPLQDLCPSARRFLSERRAAAGRGGTGRRRTGSTSR